MTLNNTIKMTNEFCKVLTAVECNGIAIDTAALDSIEKQYVNALSELKTLLGEQIKYLMGDTNIALGSDEQCSMLVYSRRVKDKKMWRRVFGIGKAKDNLTQHDKRRLANPVIRRKLINALTEVVYKTNAEQCPECKGVGSFAFVKKNGEEGKRRVKCSNCSGEGIIYTNTKEVAGLKMLPTSLDDISDGGFKTNHSKLEEFADNAQGQTKETLTALVHYNTFSSYITNNINGIRSAIRPSGLIHPTFMQFVTKTGRLSSRDPNFQNQPRGDYCSYCRGPEHGGCRWCLHTGYRFPIRRCFVSRWKGGLILVGDFSQLEFRAAAELSRCTVAIQAIINGVDVHADTSSILTEAGEPRDRQSSKAHTFKPLYGGMSGTKAQVAYYKWFLDHYSGIREWQDRLLRDAVNNKVISIPSGREYAFPYAKRWPNGGVSGSTKIKNYPVQGFATADIVPLATMNVFYKMKAAGLKSVIFNEVHDDIEVDVYPGEREQAIDIMREGMGEVHKLVKDWYGYDMVVPIATELKIGENLLEMKKV